MHHARTGASLRSPPVPVPCKYRRRGGKQVMVFASNDTPQEMGIKSINMVSNLTSQKVEKFPVRLHSFLELASNDAVLSSIVSWLPDGKSFTVHDQALFTELVLPGHFGGMNSYKSFRRQLNLYGITKNTQDQQHSRNVTGKLPKNRSDYTTPYRN